MTGETDLKKLIQNMKPELNPGEYVFCTLSTETDPGGYEPLGWFREKEGITLILTKAQADQAGFAYSFVSAWITLNIHSALEAVGLTAAVSQALALAGISCNMIAAYYHDHLFVPVKEADRALEILQAMTIES